MSKGKQLTGRIEGDGDILTREQVLQILSEMAQTGSVSAAIALERALRLDDPDDDHDELDAELERLLRRDE
jgi:3-oxoacyl-[acyl-carrier-protein] synthase III